DAEPTSAKEAFALDSANDQSKLSLIHFLRLKLFDKQGRLLSENFYLMGNKYHDYTALQNLPKVGELSISEPVITKASNGHQVLTYTITNTSTKTPAVGI